MLIWSRPSGKSLHTARHCVMSPLLRCSRSIPQTCHVYFPATLTHALLLTCHRLLSPALPTHLYPTHPSNLSVGEGSWVSPISVATLFVRSFH